MLATLLGGAQAVSLGVSIYQGYDTVKGVVTGNTLTRRLDDLDRKLDETLNRIGDNLAVSDVREVRDAGTGLTHEVDLSPALTDQMKEAQQDIAAPLIQSGLIEAPEALMRVFGENPERLLTHVRQLAKADYPEDLVRDPTMVPVVFEKWGTHFVGWIKEGILSITMNLDYKPRLSDILNGGADTVRPDTPPPSVRTAAAVPTATTEEPAAGTSPPPSPPPAPPKPAVAQAAATGGDVAALPQPLPPRQPPAKMNFPPRPDPTASGTGGWGVRMLVLCCCIVVAGVGIGSARLLNGESKIVFESDADALIDRMDAFWTKSVKGFRAPKRVAYDAGSTGQRVALVRCDVTMPRVAAYCPSEDAVYYRSETLSRSSYDSTEIGFPARYALAHAYAHHVYDLLEGEEETRGAAWRTDAEAVRRVAEREKRVDCIAGVWFGAQRSGVGRDELEADLNRAIRENRSLSSRSHVDLESLVTYNIKDRVRAFTYGSRYYTLGFCLRDDLGF